MTRPTGEDAMSSEHVEVLRGLTEVCRAAIKAGDWKVDGACDPDSLLRHADAAIASLSAPQPPAEAQAVGKVSKDTGLTVTLERLPYYTGTRLAKGTELYAHPPPSAPVGAAEAQGGRVMRYTDGKWTPVGVPVGVVREYLDARACYEAATRPPNSHARAPVLKHDNPDARRLREARAALDSAIALAQQPEAVEEADRDDARRYRALVATGKYVPAMREGWGLACGSAKASKAELDAAADALASQPGGSDNDR